MSRQVFAPRADGAHVLPGNAVLPSHQGMIITGGLQELACLLPQDLSFDTVTRLLGWQTQEVRVLSDTTVPTLVRTYGQIIRQAQAAEVTALLERTAHRPARECARAINGHRSIGHLLFSCQGLAQNLSHDVL